MAPPRRCLRSGKEQPFLHVHIYWTAPIGATSTRAPRPAAARYVRAERRRFRRWICERADRRCLTPHHRSFQRWAGLVCALGDEERGGGSESQRGPSKGGTAAHYRQRRGRLSVRFQDLPFYTSAPFFPPPSSLSLPSPPPVRAAENAAAARRLKAREAAAA